MRFVRLSAADFERATAGSDTDARTLALARGVMVDGLLTTSVAALSGVTVQRVAAAVRTVDKACREDGTIDCGWVTTGLLVPHALARELERVARALLAIGVPALTEEVTRRLLAALAGAHVLVAGAPAPIPDGKDEA